MNAKTIDKVLVRIDGKVLGPFPVTDLLKIKGFTPQTLVSFPGSEKWATAWRALKINVYAPPAVTSPGGYQDDGEWKKLIHLEERPLHIQYVQGYVSEPPVKKEEAWVDEWLIRLGVWNIRVGLALLVLGLCLPARKLHHQAFPINSKPGVHAVLKNPAKSLRPATFPIKRKALAKHHKFVG